MPNIQNISNSCLNRLIGILIIRDFSITSSNAAFEKLTGYDNTELIGLSLKSIFFNDIDYDNLRNCYILIKRDQVKKFQRRIKHKNDSVLWVDISVTFLNEETNEYVFTFNDITKIKKLEEDQRIAATAFESNECIVIIDSNAIILKANKSFTRISGYEPIDLVGNHINILESGRYNDDFYNLIIKSIKEDGRWTGEIDNRRKNGEIFPTWLSVTSVNNEYSQVTHYVITFTDISLRKDAENQIKNLAFFDYLTQLPNRRLLMDRLCQVIINSNRHKNKGALLFIDLDNFKTINDTLGHHVGDELLKQVASRLNTCVRENDTVARFGGDEFVIMLENLSEDSLNAAVKAEFVGLKILKTLSCEYNLGQHLFSTTASIGITLLDGELHDSLNDPLKRADLAMYKSKSSGRNALRFFEPEMQTSMNSRAEMDFDLRQAVANNQFCLFYQPQLDDSNKIIGAEALIRWVHPTRGLVAPLEFIPLIEENGLILTAGQWVLETACFQLKKWSYLKEFSKLTISVNVSAHQFHQSNFTDQVFDALRKSAANPELLIIELTESTLLQDITDVILKINKLKQFGIKFSIDDFGTGYSSLVYLKQLPLDQLKIDKCFIQDILTDDNDAAISKMIITLAQNLNIEVIAEGVETNSQRNYLNSIGCRFYQGFLFSRPVPILEFQKLDFSNSSVVIASV